MGAVAAAATAVAAVVTAVSSSRKSKPPPPITSLPHDQQIANRVPPVNFAQIFDEVSGNQMQFIRGTDGKIALKFGNARDRIPLDAPMPLERVNTNLPAVRQISGRNITQEAGAVIVLMQALRQLTSTIERVEQTSPLLVAENRDILDSFKAAQNQALDKGFDIRQQAIDTKLTKMGLMNSSTALGTQIALAKERVDAQLKANLEYTTLAQSLKQQSLDNMYKRGDQIAQNANVELGRFATETSNQLQMRQQDMQADLATQELSQRRSLAESQLQLANNEQILNAETTRRQFRLAQQQQMNALGVDLVNNTNSQAIAAKATDNHAIANANNANFTQYGLRSNPWQNAFFTGVGSLVGGLGGNLADRLLPPPQNQQQSNTSRG